MKTVTTFVWSLLILSFVFLSLPENSNAQDFTIPPLPGGCCQYVGVVPSNLGQDICADISPGLKCPFNSDRQLVGFFELETCNLSTGQCEVPRNVPTLSEWGLIAMAGVMGLVGFILLRRKKATA